MAGQKVRAFVEKLAKTCGPRLMRYLAVRRYPDPEDIAQETYEHLLKLKSDPALIRAPVAYAKKVAKTIAGVRAMNAEKHREAHERVAVERALDLERQQLANDPARCHELERAAHGALARHRSAHREMLLMKRDGYRDAEIAEKLGLPVSKVKRYLVTARARERSKSPKKHSARRNTGRLRRKPKEG